MRLQPLIKSRLEKFKKQHEIDDLRDGIAFEMFANKMILCNHQPDAFNVDSGLMDAVCVGGENDTGIDGLCIKLNGMLVSSLDEAIGIFELRKEAEIEFIFIQSKYKEGFEQKEFVAFINGVEDFLDEEQYQPRNDKVSNQLLIKDYLFSDEVTMHWIKNPIVRLYYIVMGEWNESPHVLAAEEKFVNEINAMNMYEDVLIKYVDALAFKRICDDNDNNFKTTLSVEDLFHLPPVNDVENSMIALISAEQLMSLLKTEDGLLRKNLFEDNVRDFQGDTLINNEILNTIEKVPSNFVLLNNGITIVCQEATQRHRNTVVIKNPQIVNGCQTCSVLFQAAKKGLCLENVVVTAKIIGTYSYDIANYIVKGTNRQNIVYDEAFEITREFHKELEEFFTAMSTDHYRLFYERRSRQYADNLSIIVSEKVNFKILIQSFISIFLNEPHQGHRHQSRLLKDYKNKIFIEAQSKYPYYVACKIHQQFDKYIRLSDAPKSALTYKMHVLLLFKLLAWGHSPDVNDEKQIEIYCVSLMRVLSDKHKCDRYMRDAITTFDRIRGEWTKKMGSSYRFAIKDSEKFVSFMINTFDGKREAFNTPNERIVHSRGIVKKVALDKNDRLYGFISARPRDIYFNAQYNPNLNFGQLEGEHVLYTLSTSRTTGMNVAVDVRVIDRNLLQIT